MRLILLALVAVSVYVAADNQFTLATVKSKLGGDGKILHVKVPWRSQFIGGFGYQPGSLSCFYASLAMARDAGVDGTGTATEVNPLLSPGQIITTEKAADVIYGLDYIKKELSTNRPVLVGLMFNNDKNLAYRVEGPRVGKVDHYIVITGYGIDTLGHYFTYHDPGTSDNQVGMDANPANKVRVDLDAGKMTGMSTGTDSFYVAMVRKNFPSFNTADARKRGETVSQDAVNGRQQENKADLSVGRQQTSKSDAVNGRQQTSKADGAAVGIQSAKKNDNLVVGAQQASKAGVVVGQQSAQKNGLIVGQQAASKNGVIVGQQAASKNGVIVGAQQSNKADPISELPPGRT